MNVLLHIQKEPCTKLYTVPSSIHDGLLHEANNILRLVMMRVFAHFGVVMV